MSQTILSRIFQAAARLREERYGHRNRNYGALSHNYDAYSDQELRDGLDPGKFVRLDDVLRIYSSVASRKEFRLSEQDYEQYITPFIKTIQRDIRNNSVPAYLSLNEKIIGDARLSVGDLRKMIVQNAFPDGGAQGPKATESTTVSIDADFGTGKLADWRRAFSRAFPLRTPSVDVEHKTIMADHPLNIHRALILALGMASIFKDQRDIIESAQIPLYSTTQWSRNIAEQKNAHKNPGRVYRGVKIK